MQGTKKKSKRWSLADMNKIKGFIDTSVNFGGSIEDGKKAAAKHFGTTLNAIRIKYGRYLKGVAVPKEPVKDKAPANNSKNVLDKVVALKKAITNARKPRGKNWTKKDVRTLKMYLERYPNREKAYEHAALFFNRTPSAVAMKCSKLGLLKRVKVKKTPASINWATGKPHKNQGIDAIIDDGGISRVKRKYTKKERIAEMLKAPITHNLYPVAREITFDIRDVKVDLANKKITFIY